MATGELEHNDTILEISELTDGLETSLRVFVATSYLRYDEEMHSDILSEARELMIRVRESGIEQGMKNADIAQALNVSISTVRTYEPYNTAMKFIKTSKK